MAAGGGAQVKGAGLSPDELRQVTFTTSAGVHGAPLAEFAVFGVLAGAKDLPTLQRLQANKEWPGRWCMKQVNELTVIVVGLGIIGREAAIRLSALGARVIGVHRNTDDLTGVASVVGLDRLAEVVADADALVVALPGTDATHQLISDDVLRAVKPGITVVNVGRGTTIDEDALVAALTDGRVGFAALDVFYTEPLPTDSPLWALPNVLVSPHTAALNDAEDRLIADVFVENARRLLDGEPLINVVDTVEFY